MAATKSADTIVGKLYSYRDVLAFDWSHYSTVPYPPEIPMFVPHDMSYVGIEVEVEGIPGGIRGLSPVWAPKADGSLRNNGTEYVTMPIPVQHAEWALFLLMNSLPKSADFSERTSIHVHMNVRHMTPNQIKGLIALYLAVEKLLFRFEGNGRDSSIFCVPLTQATLLDSLYSLTAANFGTQAWMKYTAMNLLPILTFGTIEFRHMAGTSDWRKITRWISLLMRMQDYALKNSPETVIERIAALNTSSMYRHFLLDVFRDQASLFPVDNLQQDMEKNILQVKLSLARHGERFNDIDAKSPLFLKWGRPRAKAKSLYNLERFADGQVQAVMPGDWAAARGFIIGERDGPDMEARNVWEEVEVPARPAVRPVDPQAALAQQTAVELDRRRQLAEQRLMERRNTTRRRG